MKMKIAVLTGGGDCPGLNGAVKWVTKSAMDQWLGAKRPISFEVMELTMDGGDCLMWILMTPKAS